MSAHYTLQLENVRRIYEFIPTPLEINFPNKAAPTNKVVQRIESINTVARWFLSKVSRFTWTSADAAFDRERIKEVFDICPEEKLFYIDFKNGNLNKSVCEFL